jgi:hypothetical protein
MRNYPGQSIRANIVSLIGAGPFHVSVPSTHETVKDPLFSITKAVSTLSVCLHIATGAPVNALIGDGSAYLAGTIPDGD